MLETDNSTPYFLNLHNGEVAQTLILGMTGSGKSKANGIVAVRLSCQFENGNPGAALASFERQYLTKDRGHSLRRA